MIKLSASVVPALLLCFISAAVAQTTAPATRSAALDQTTPRGAMKMFIAADATSDGDAIRKLLAGSNVTEREMIGAIADKKNADRELTDALMAKFPGDWKTDPRKEAQAQLPLVYDKIDTSDQKIDGDTATLTAPGGGGSPFTFKRVDGKWCIPLAVLYEEVDPDKLRHDTHQIEIQVIVMRGAAAQVAAGKYATESAAIDDVKQRIFDAAVADHSATQPATAPSVAPSDSP